jgi:hypothetical protein
MPLGANHILLQFEGLERVGVFCVCGKKGASATAGREGGRRGGRGGEGGRESESRRVEWMSV